MLRASQHVCYVLLAAAAGVLVHSADARQLLTLASVDNNSEPQTQGNCSEPSTPCHHWGEPRKHHTPPAASRSRNLHLTHTACGFPLHLPFTTYRSLREAS